MHGGDIYRNEIEVDFSVNINPCGVPIKVQSAMFNALKDVTKYSDIECLALRKKIAEKFNCSYENVLCGNGASELILAICRAFKPKKIMMSAPGFSGYRKQALAIAAELCSYKLKKEENFEFNINNFLEALDKNKPDMVFITNPNNPNGGVISNEDIVTVKKACKKEKAVLVIDECFKELVTPGNEDRQESYEDAIYLRAFTKSFAIPGIRLGYVICKEPEYIIKIQNQLSEWNVSVIANAAGLSALEEDDFLEASRKLILEERDYLKKELEKLAIKVYPSKANFLLIETDRDLKEELLKKKILIRDCSDYEGLQKNFYRIAVKTREENNILINAIKGNETELKKEKVEYVLPGDIEKRSFEIIGEECKKRGIVIPEEQADVTKRVIHTSADFEYAATLVYSENAIYIARDLIKKGAHIVTDTNMAKAGISKTTLSKFGGEVHCFMADEDVANEAKKRKVTRATVSMERASKLDKPVIFAIGNAPTALISLKELMDKTGYKPAFIIGVPVGFVNVEAAKELIIESDVPYIVNRGRKGGSNVAAAICNALMYGMIER